MEEQLNNSQDNLQNNRQDNTAKKVITIILVVVAASVIGFGIKAYIAKSAYDHAVDKGTKELNKAYDRVQRDMNESLRNLGF